MTKISTTLLMLLFSATAYAQAENWSTVADRYHLSAYLVAFLLIGVFVLIFSNRLYYYREQEVSSRAKQLNTQLALVLNSNKTEVWTYDVTKVFTLISSETVTRTVYAPIDFAQFFNHDDFEELRTRLTNVLIENSLSETLLVKSHNGLKTYEINISVLKRDQKHHPMMLLGVQRDITESKRRGEKTHDLSLQYQTVFNSSLVDMIFYGPDGRLMDLNEKACETFMIADRKSFLKKNVHINDIPSYRHINIHELYDSIRLSSITDIDQVKREDERIPDVKLGGTFYYEAILSPIRDEAGVLHGVMAAGRNITEMVESHHKQEEEVQLLQKTNQQIQAYIQNINYTLKTSGVRIITYHPGHHELRIFSDLNQVQYRLSQIRCASLIHESDRRRLRGLFMRMDQGKASNISEVLHTIFHDDQKRDVYMNFSLIPMTDKEGRVTLYFGLCRDETEMKYTEMRLMEESKKAQETEELKNAFLLNMSYELRVPLHAVLGFAELFKTEHNQEDEPIFANEIKKNTDVLLNLINDILFISRLDAHMIEYNYEVHDFATLFDAWCLHGWGETNNKTRKIINNTYESLRVKIDKHNLGIAIEKLCNFIGLSTNEGLIKSRYEYLHDELIVIVDSTDGGMDLEDATKMFDRFVSDGKNKRVGTGLDLPIVKEMIEQMGGTIDVLSEPNKGSSFFIALPCEMIDFERKIER